MPLRPEEGGLGAGFQLVAIASMEPWKFEIWNKKLLGENQGKDFSEKMLSAESVIHFKKLKTKRSKYPLKKTVEMHLKKEKCKNTSML